MTVSSSGLRDRIPGAWGLTVAVADCWKPEPKGIEEP